MNWVQLWANGPKFAEYNVGAASATEYGGYYTWGGYNDKEEDYYNTGVSNLSCTGNFITDTATNIWGSNWRMPTKEELDKLLANCDVAWTNDYKGDNTNIKGAIFTGKQGTAFASNSVFLPAAGFCASGTVLGQGGYGYFWSSTPNGGNNAYSLLFGSVNLAVGSNYRGNGQSVRSVTE